MKSYDLGIEHRDATNDQGRDIWEQGLDRPKQLSAVALRQTSVCLRLTH